MKLKYLRHTFILAIVILLQFHSASGEKSPGAESDCVSIISIHGSSNVNKFQLTNHNPRIVRSSEKAEDKKRYQRIQIAVTEFQGENERMREDFLELVNASEYPFISMAIEPRILQRCLKNKGVFDFKTIITMAGITKSYIVPCKLDTCGSSSYMLNGKLEIKLTDFGIEPPRKFFGLIKVHNEVLIDYVFRFQADDDIFRK